MNCYVTFESRLKWRQLVEYSTDVIDRLYQTKEKKGPVSGRRVSTQIYCDSGGYGTYLNQYDHRSWNIVVSALSTAHFEKYERKCKWLVYILPISDVVVKVQC